MGTSQTNVLEAQLGFWTNWSHGPVLGATLTLTRSHADLLIAFTSLFLGLVGTRFWRILCLVLHRFYSRPFERSRDGLHHQKQLILRNSQAPEAGLYDLLRLSFAWRGHAKNPFAATALSALSAALTFAAFMVAGGFSATISSSPGREVLLKTGLDCDWTADIGSINENRAKRAAIIHTYVQQCYSPEVSGLVDCATFVKPSIPYTVDKNASCPFKAGICKSETDNLYLDSGYIDSHHHIGLNAPADDAIRYRTKLHCAPLTTDGYTSVFKQRGIDYTKFHYGRLYDFSGDTDRETLNYSYIVESRDVQYSLTQTPLKLDSRHERDFLLGFNSAYLKDGKYTPQGFIPGPELQRPDADTFIAYLSGNGVVFEVMIDDPWYQATDEISIPDILFGDPIETVYRPNVAASPLACAAQYQWCLGSGEPKDTGDDANCGQLGSVNDALRSVYRMLGAPSDVGPSPYSDELRWGSRQMTRFNWFCKIWFFLSLPPMEILKTLGPSVLSGRQGRKNNVRGTIPKDQWQLDMTQAWSISLATLQTTFVEVARGDINSTTVDISDHDEEKNKYEKEMCGIQKILSSRYGSFSVVGLSITYFVGLLVIVLSWVIEPILDRRLNKARKESQHINAGFFRHLEWITNETLQQHRLAQSELGWGGKQWKNATGFVPIPQEGQDLGGLNVRDPYHTALFAPGDVDEMLSVEEQSKTPGSASDKRTSVSLTKM